MKIRPISLYTFTSTPRKPEYERDRYATLSDLYETEDRIIEHQNKLFHAQNVAFAKVLGEFNQQLYYGLPYADDSTRNNGERYINDLANAKVDFKI